MLKANTHATKTGRKRLIILLAIIVITVICAVFSFNYVTNHKYTGNGKQIVIKAGEGIDFNIPKGSNTSKIANLLKEKGFINNVSWFRLLSRINGYDGKYQSGTHILSKSLSYDELMQVLTNKPTSIQVTIPEGTSFIQIVDILYNKKVIKDKNKFIKIANNEKFDYDFLKDLSPRDNRLEGYIFPDTYRFDINASEKEIINTMLANFDKKLKKEYRDKLKELKGMTLDKIIVLASIIEREAKDPDDRAIISAVFYNRLKENSSLKKLQSCATIQYILLKTTGSIKERLYNKDLEIDDPYNTYKYEGLPPGPICCPGEASIKAALFPVKTDYLYFVAKGDGSHQFSRTFKEHQQAIKKFGLH